MKLKRTWKIAAVGVCAAVVLTVAFAAAAGSEGDPLITLGYLKNIFTPQVQTMVDDAVAAGQEQNKTDLDAAIQQWDATVKDAVENAASTIVGEEPASFAAVTISEGKTITILPGCEVIVRSGAPVCSAALIDETNGTTLAAGKTLSANHLYLATEPCTFSVPAAQLTGTINAGPLNVRAGAGSGYDILGTLQEGAVVTILEDTGSGWYMVTGGGLAGYVSADYVDLNPVSAAGPVELLLRGDYTAE